MALCWGFEKTKEQSMKLSIQKFISLLGVIAMMVSPLSNVEALTEKQKLPHLLNAMGVDLTEYAGDSLTVISPIDGKEIASIRTHSVKELDGMIDNSIRAFEAWRTVPAPKRGELIRIFGEELRAHKLELGTLVSRECGKILEEGKGEVQEMIDICDFSVGLSRQLYGLTIASERPEHVMSENWYPIGPVGVISAFNFPVAVWAWNTALAVTCGDSVIWKPSEKTPLTAIACLGIFQKAVKKYEKISGEKVPDALVQVVIGDAEVGERLVSDRRIPLISATGSCRMGGIVGPKVASRFGRSLLELGGNNAIIVAPSADLNVALPSILFGAVGTAGQRCTSTRRLFVHRSLYDTLSDKLLTAYHDIQENKIGNPLDGKALVGPLIDKDSFEAMKASLEQAKEEGGKVFYGNRMFAEDYPNAYYVAPALVKMAVQTEIVKKETFAPILYVIPYDSLEEAMIMHNDVPQGLSSGIFTTDVRDAEYFRQNSDTGIANVNIGTSGAEIGGAFGGEKETGGGRESGTDSWKNYMRRQTSTTYYGKTAPALAQGVKFGD
ncbi:MAG: aldehyde dehydrogenase (NAD+) [Chlamydiales bacterium]